jgi:hypothetical protein
MGGCPKKQLEKDTGALDAQSLYWRQHLPRLICRTANIPEVEWQFTERDQFRLASPSPTTVPLEPATALI